MVTIDAARTQWSSADVLTGVTRLAAEGRAVTADLIALLAVLDERRLFEAEGCGSLFEFCVRRLRLSESQAYHRIQASRAAARFPAILEHLREGAVTLTSVALLRPVLTEENHEQLLREAAGRTKRDVEGLVRSLAPLPDVPVSIRKVAPGAIPAVAVSRRQGAEPESLEHRRLFGAAARRTGDLGIDEATIELAPVRPADTGAAPRRPAEIRPLAPTRYSLRVTISEATHAKLRRCQDLLGHTIPDGDAAAILDRALTVLVAQLERQKFAATTAPGRPRVGAAGRGGPAQPPSLPPGPGRARARGRHIPAAVRRAVWARDEGRCGYVGRGRCTQTRRLEFHHRVPFADGGAATVDNLALRCRCHNGTEARRWAEDDRRVSANSDRSESPAHAGP